MVVVWLQEYTSGLSFAPHREWKKTERPEPDSHVNQLQAPERMKQQDQCYVFLLDFWKCCLINEVSKYPKFVPVSCFVLFFVNTVNHACFLWVELFIFISICFICITESFVKQMLCHWWCELSLPLKKIFYMTFDYVVSLKTADLWVILHIRDLTTLFWI